MKASIVDLRRKMSDVLRALARGERVTILYRGKEKAVMHPTATSATSDMRASQHAAFGMWRNRDDMEDVGEAVRRIRKGRADAV